MKTLQTESETRFQEMAETIPAHVWTATPDGMLDFVTVRTARYFGRPVEELLGTGWAAMVHPADLERVAERWRHSIATGEPYETEFRVYSSESGDFRWHLVRASALRDSGGQVVKWFGCNADIEDQKRAEQALDAALVDVKLANKAKSDFLAMMSHELRTPLNAIGGYTQLMLEGIPTPPSDGQLKFLTRIMKSQQHLLKLIEAVLLYAKIEAGRVTYTLGDFRAWEILDVLDSLTAPQRAAKNLTYDCAGCDTRLLLRGDKEKVVQIMLNLLSNATKFTPRDGHIAIQTMADGNVGVIRVCDTGIGMSAEQLDVLFEPYVQFDSSLAREHEGTGLGMPISRELARGMGGDLTASSEPGAGSTFTLTLPLGSVAAPSPG